MTAEAQSELFAPAPIPAHARPRITGTQYRDAALNAVEANADEAWKRGAWAVIESLAALGRPFTSEDVRRLAGDPPGSGNVMGALIRKAGQAGLIRQAGWTKAERPGLHATDLRLWEGVS